MAKKSKTQRAKASAARQQKKVEREAQEAVVAAQSSEDAEEQPQKKSLFKKNEAADTQVSKASESAPAKQAIKKSEDKPKKKHFQFLRDVRAEMKRVTWPTRPDVLRWTGVVIVALIFFGVFVAVLDNVIVTPLLVLISGL